MQVKSAKNQVLLRFSQDAMTQIYKAALEL